jgi:diguanylate cyclase (GGDEF)-like protein
MPEANSSINDRLSERFLQTVTGTALWFTTSLIILGASVLPDVAPNNVNFWRVAIGVPALLIGISVTAVGKRLSDRQFQWMIDLWMIPALAVNFILLQITPATIAVLFNLIVTLIFGGYFVRRWPLLLTVIGAVAISLSTLFTDLASQTPYLGAFLTVYIPTIVLTALLLHLQNSETTGALDEATYRSLTDPLTGLANLRALKREARATLGRRVRGEQDHVAGLLLIDLDNFKSANTLHGHLGGDHALRMIAYQLRRAAPKGAVVARVGGDEFAVLMRASTRARIEEAGEIFRGAVRAASSIMEMPGVEIDATVGAAVYPEDGRDLNELLDTADKAMYASKGEKRHVVPDPDTAPMPGDARPEWIDAAAPGAQRAEHSRLNLDSLTGGNNAFLATRSLYARTSALAFAVGSIVLGASQLMPSAYPDPKIPWWVIMFGGLLLSVGIFILNTQAQSARHLLNDFIALSGVAALVALTGGFASPALALLIMLAASQAWFWQKRMVALRTLGPALVALSPFLYDTVPSGQLGGILYITVFAEVAVLVCLVVSMYFDRWLLATLQDRAEHLARIDPLTGVSNRRAFDDFVQDLLDGSEEPEPFAIVMIDLDNFKQVNTVRGHRGGDAVLIAIAASLASVARADDCIARVGGDEFAAVLPGVGVDGARALAERFVATVASTTAAREADVGASAGFALYPLHGETLDQLAFTADGALMAVKASGKGSARVARVVSAV